MPDSDSRSWDLLQKLLDDASKLQARDRESFIESQCPAALRDDLRQLLIALEDPAPLPAAKASGEALAARSSAPLESASASSSSAAQGVPVLEPGLQIGNYRLGELLGSGGMGEVYAAEQTQPLQRSVAIKFIRQGFGAADFLPRFERERQAIALMDHPGIARIYDVDATPAGLPFFVMERVDGAPITRFCDEQELDIRSRVELFVKVCRAVQHAHQKGVIHRDLKPSNLLVTKVDEVAQPKVIDFGIAKAIDPTSDLKSGAETVAGQLIGTPQYMSPEQAKLRRDIDTRSDVFSLGVVFYELLTGHTPHRQPLVDLDLGELQRAICEEPVTRPSVVVSRRARSTAPSGGTRARSLASELDWIALRALHKDRDQRYQSAAELADDLERYLRNEAVEAGPPSARYRLRKFLSRHRTASLAAASVLALLLVFAVVSRLQFQQTQRALARAEAESSKASGVADFLIELLQENDPNVSRGEPRSVRALLKSGAERILGGDVNLDQHPELRATLLGVIAQIETNLGNYDAARPLATRAVELARELEDPSDEAFGSNLHLLALLLFEQGEFETAENLLTEAMDYRAQRFGPRSAEVALTHDGFGIVYRAMVRTEEAIEHHRKAQSIRDELGLRGTAYAESANLLGIALRRAGDIDAAIEQYRIASEIWEGIHGPDHPQVAMVLNNLGLAQHVSGDFAAARETFEDLVPRRLRHLGPDHSDYATTLSNLAVLLLDLGEFEPAERLQRLALQIRVEAAGELDGPAIAHLSNLGAILRAAGKRREALETDQRVVELRRELFGERHSVVADGLYNLSRSLALAGQLEEAERALRQGLVLHREHQRTGSVASAAAELGLQLLERGELVAAQEPLREALESALRMDPQSLDAELARAAGALAHLQEADARATVASLRQQDLTKRRFIHQERVRRVLALYDRMFGAGAPD